MMRANKPLLFGMVWLLLGASGCGRSPLLNHSTEAPPPSQGAPQENPGNGTCALSWENPRLCANVRWQVGPKEGECELRLLFDTDLDAGRAVDVWADMPEMGHGTAPVRITRVGAREILVSSIWFIMPGRWVMHVTLGGIERIFEVRI